MHIRCEGFVRGNIGIWPIQPSTTIPTQIEMVQYLSHLISEKFGLIIGQSVWIDTYNDCDVELCPDENRSNFLYWMTLFVGNQSTVDLNSLLSR